MLIYLIVEVVTDLLTEVVQILGQINLYAILQPVVSLLQEVAGFAIEIIQAVISVALSIIQVCAVKHVGHLRS